MLSRLDRSVTRRMFSDCPATQAPARTLLSKPMTTAHLPGDLGQAVEHVGGAFFVVGRVVEGVQGVPGARVDQVFEPLPDGQLPPGVDLFRREPDVFDLFHGASMTWLPRP